MQAEQAYLTVQKYQATFVQEISETYTINEILWSQT